MAHQTRGYCSKCGKEAVVTMVRRKEKGGDIGRCPRCSKIVAFHAMEFISQQEEKR